MKTGEPVESLSLSKILVLYMRKYQMTYGKTGWEIYIHIFPLNVFSYFKEHLKSPSPNMATTGHPTLLDNFNIASREGQSSTRTMKESMFTRVNNPSFKGNIDKYKFPHIWVGVLNNTPKLKVKNQWECDHLLVHKTSLVPPRSTGRYNSRHQHFSSDLKKAFSKKDESLFKSKWYFVEMEFLSTYLDCILYW